MIVIIDYGMGNGGSIQNMLDRLGHEAVISGRPEDILVARLLILPGVGAFDKAVLNLRQRGLIDVLQKKVIEERTPILGICLGMQLFGRRSEEGDLPGLNWLDAETVRFRVPPDRSLKIPHMGWANIEVVRADPPFDGLPPEPRFYFVHSYHLECRDDGDIAATASYGRTFTAAVRRGPIVGTQFHPEKSHKFGLRLLGRFVEAFG